jgi:putative ABC transport system substrate-binding protein
MGRLGRRQLLIRAAAFSLMPIASARAQQPRLYRVGVIFQGGTYAAAVEGLREGLRELGLEDGKQLILHVRDVKSDLKSVAANARSLEQERVDVIYSVGSSVTVQAKAATKSVPIVFYAGTDPISTGLIASFAKPAGRLTGVYSRFNDLVPKRFELLKQLVPKMRRAVVFYVPGNPIAMRSAKEIRAVAPRFNVQIVEYEVSTVDELRMGLRALRPAEVDAFFQVTDGFIISQAELITTILREKKIASMFSSEDAAAKGALAGYGVSYGTAGRHAAKYVQRILLGNAPGDMPVELMDTFHFVINLKTAKSIGLTIPDSLLARADTVIR